MKKTSVLFYLIFWALGAFAGPLEERVRFLRAASTEERSKIALETFARLLQEEDEVPRVADVADALNVSAPTISNLFGSREKFYLACYQKKPFLLSLTGATLTSPEAKQILAEEQEFLFKELVEQFDEALREQRFEEAVSGESLRRFFAQPEKDLRMKSIFAEPEKLLRRVFRRFSVHVAAAIDENNQEKVLYLLRIIPRLKSTLSGQPFLVSDWRNLERKLFLRFVLLYNGKLGILEIAQASRMTPHRVFAYQGYAPGGALEEYALFKRGEFFRSLQREVKRELKKQHPAEFSERLEKVLSWIESRLTCEKL